MPLSAICLDRDGTIIEEKHYLKDPDLVVLEQNVVPALQKIQAAGLPIFIITNQSGIGRGLISVDEYNAVHARLIELLSAEGIQITATYYCPDHPENATPMRKPEPGMLHAAASDYGFDVHDAVMIGDKPADVACGQAAGAKSVWVQTGYGASSEPPNPPADYVAKDCLDAVEHFILPLLES